MTKDNNKNITGITYNHLNLPTLITFAATGNIAYIYNVSGQKIQKVVNRNGVSAVTTDYLGGYQYENSALKFFPTSEGYIEPEAGSYKYVYQYKDHLGNVRLSYDKNLTIKEESNYYPFGLKQEGYNTVKSGVENKYKYNGKELQDELGLNMYDYGARNYDPALGRFNVIDPWSEKFENQSPYLYGNNAPVRYTDFLGLGAEDEIDKDKEKKKKEEEKKKEEKKKEEKKKEELVYIKEIDIKPKMYGSAGALEYIEGGVVIKGAEWLFKVINGAETLGTLSDSFAQRGNNNGRLQDDKLEAIQAKKAAGTATSAELQKLKKHEKNTGQRSSRQSKDKK